MVQTNSPDASKSGARLVPCSNMFTKEWQTFSSTGFRGIVKKGYSVKRLRWLIEWSLIVNGEQGGGDLLQYCCCDSYLCILCKTGIIPAYMTCSFEAFLSHWAPLIQCMASIRMVLEVLRKTQISTNQNMSGAKHWNKARNTHEDFVFQW